MLIHILVYTLRLYLENLSRKKKKKIVSNFFEYKKYVEETMGTTVEEI